jgi:AcrR family transcriptional regulator
LLDALEAVLLRDGLRNLTVNAVVEVSGIAKPLLYRYFGGLAGLARAWGQRRGFWSGGDEAPRSRMQQDDIAFRREIATELLASAERLRANPVTMEFLAEELTAESDLSAAFAEARAAQRRPYLKAMLSDPRYLRRDNHRVIVIIQAALIYLAMRSRRSPHFMGIRLDTEAGWRDVLAMARELAEVRDHGEPVPDSETSEVHRHEQLIAMGTPPTCRAAACLAPRRAGRCAGQ